MASPIWFKEFQIYGYLWSFMVSWTNRFISIHIFSHIFTTSSLGFLTDPPATYPRGAVASPRGVAVDAASIRFVASQPWLFPRSLLLGFTAQAANERIEVDREEMEVPWDAMGCHGMPWMVPPNCEVRWIFTLGYGRKNTTWSWRIPEI